MRGIGVVFGKEFKESLRDRRSLMSALVMGPLLGPIMFAVMLGVIFNMEQERAEKPLEVPVVGAEHAPNLVQWLKQEGVRIEPAPADPEAVVRDNDEPMVLIIPEAFGAQLTNGEPAIVTVIQDRSRRDNQTLVSRLENHLQRYGRTIGALRLQARGINPAISQAVVVRSKDLSTPESRGALILGMLPYFLMFAVFMGGMYLAIDTTAGERERKSLEPLLLNPVRRSHIMLGKLGATVLMALVSLGLSIFAFSIAMGFLPLAELGMALTLDASTCLYLFLILAPIALLAGALETIIAAFSKSFREAQTYVSFVFFLPIIPTLALFLVPVQAKLWMMLIPIFSQSLVIEKLLRGELPQPLFVAVSIIATLIAGAVLAAIAAGLYHRERLAFSEG